MHTNVSRPQSHKKLKSPRIVGTALAVNIESIISMGVLIYMYLHPSAQARCKSPICPASFPPHQAAGWLRGQGGDWPRVPPPFRGAGPRSLAPSAVCRPGSEAPPGAAAGAVPVVPETRTAVSARTCPLSPFRLGLLDLIWSKTLTFFYCFKCFFLKKSSKFLMFLGFSTFTR